MLCPSLIRLCLIWMYRNTAGSPWGNFHGGACFCVCWWKPGQGSFTCLRTPPSRLEGFGSEPEPQTLFRRCMSLQSQGCEPPPWGTPTLHAACWSRQLPTDVASAVSPRLYGPGSRVRPSWPQAFSLWFLAAECRNPVAQGCGEHLLQLVWLSTWLCVCLPHLLWDHQDPQDCAISGSSSWGRVPSLVTHEARISCLVLLFKLRNIHTHTCRYVCLFRILVGLGHQCDFQWG